MDTKVILTDVGSPSVPSEQIKRLDTFSDAKKKQFAHDFESIFISKILDEMKKTIGDWGMEKDGASEQMGGIFSLYLAQDISKNGGFGMWKDIYQSLTNENKNQTVKSSDVKI